MHLTLDIINSLELADLCAEGLTVSQVGAADFSTVDNLSALSAEVVLLAPFLIDLYVFSGHFSVEFRLGGFFESLLLGWHVWNDSVLGELNFLILYSRHIMVFVYP